MKKLNEMQNEMHKKGVEVENNFIELAEKENYFCQKSTKKQDIEEHWDVQLIKNGKATYVDVKGQKKVNEDGFTWIELQNVNGDIGWLYGSKLNAIVFEREDRFDFVDVHKLRELMEIKIENKNELIFVKPENISEMKYKRYMRSGRKDIVILTPIKDIDEFIIKTIHK